MIASFQLSETSAYCMSEYDPALSFPPVTLDDMISHERVLEQYPWLSGQILSRWRRRRLIRCFRGKGGLLYSKMELDAALESEMRTEDPPEEKKRTPWTPTERDLAIDAVLAEERALRGIFKGLTPEHVEDLNRKREPLGLPLINAEPRQPPPTKSRVKHK